MTQLHLFYPPKISVDRRIDKDGRIMYLGDATYVRDNIYTCLADVGGALCVVEIRVTL